MKLKLRKFKVEDIHFADQTAFRGGVLSINREELGALLAEDPTFKKVDIELARPGESVRILQVADIVEPRARLEGGDFPGILSKTVNIVGDGSTDVLSGAAVVLVDDNGDDVGATHDAAGNVIDMSGPGAEISYYGRTYNICLIPHAADGIDPKKPNFKIASKVAALKAAVYLAQACRGLDPDEEEVYELPPLAEIARGMEELPRVVYVFNFYRYYLKDEFAIYGKAFPWFPSVLMHPNEIFDGAVVNPYLNSSLSSPATMDTYEIQNHPVVKELYRRHGEELCFLGVIPTVAQLEEYAVESQNNLALKLALSLGADGVVLTKATGGSPQMDVAQFAMKAHEHGLKSVLILDDFAARSPDGKFRVNGILYSDERAGAIVNTGNMTELIKLPPVERTIGHPVPWAGGELQRIYASLIGQGGQLGNTHIMEVEY
ncbi:MAG: glycine/sarcosine/betaine reductase component B subunit [bacterium]|jgi:sarcosine reductase